MQNPAMIVKIRTSPSRSPRMSGAGIGPNDDYGCGASEDDFYHTAADLNYEELNY